MQDKNHPFAFKIKSPDRRLPLILAAPNMATIESWMLLLIQIQMGAIKPEENFRSGDSQEAVVSALSNPLAYNGNITPRDVDHFLKIQGGNLPADPPRLECLVMKRSIYKRVWKARYIVLEKRRLKLYTSAEDANDDAKPRGDRSFHYTSRLSLLPPGFEGQQHGLALITGNPPYSDCVTLRLSFTDEQSRDEWYEALHKEIMWAVQQHQKELEDENCLALSRRRSTSLHLQRINSNSIFHFNTQSIEELRQTEVYADFYITHFLTYSAGNKYYQVTVFENQRYAPLIGWSSANLLPFSDHPKYTNIRGRKFPEPNLHEAVPPPGYRWALENINDVEDSDIASVKKSLRSRSVTIPHALGLGGFEIDTQYTSTDKDGWTYAFSFSRIQSHLTENSPHYFRKSGDFVRRRRWVRLADMKFDREI